MKNYVQPGEVLEYTAPTGGVVSGSAYKIGQILVVATVSVAAGEKFSALTEGVVELNKLDAEAWSEGWPIYWDPSPGHATSVTTSGTHLIGTAARLAASPSETGFVKLLGHAAADL
jgi:predicted RecA/RadA family phage recombinase